MQIARGHRGGDQAKAENKVQPIAPVPHETKGDERQSKLQTGRGRVVADDERIGQRRVVRSGSDDGDVVEPARDSSRAKRGGPGGDDDCPGNSEGRHRPPPTAQQQSQRQQQGVLWLQAEREGHRDPRQRPSISLQEPVRNSEQGDGPGHRLAVPEPVVHRPEAQRNEQHRDPGQPSAG